jgi:hypothetical protein
MSRKLLKVAPAKEAKLYQTPVRMDQEIRARIRAVCYHEDITKQAFLIRAVMRALEDAEKRLGLTQRSRPAKQS